MFLKSILAGGLLLICGVTSGYVNAQQLPPAQQPTQAATDISDEKLEQFVEVLGEVSAVQQEMQHEMVAVVEENGLDVNTFNQIAQQQQNPQADQSTISPEDKAAFDKAMQEVQQMQLKMQQDMQAKVEASEIDMNEFNALMMAYQQDPEVQQRVNTLLEKQ